MLDKLNEAGEALKATGERAISLSCYDGRFTVGLRVGNGYGCDVFGSADTASEAYRLAMANCEGKRAELAIRARITAEIEERVRAELAADQPQDIAA